MPEACCCIRADWARQRYYLRPEEQACRITKHPRRHKQIAKSSGDGELEWGWEAICTSARVVVCRACDNNSSAYLIYIYFCCRRLLGRNNHTHTHTHNNTSQQILLTYSPSQNKKGLRSPNTLALPNNLAITPPPPPPSPPLHIIVLASLHDNGLITPRHHESRCLG
jgi:hypothetical protein